METAGAHCLLLADILEGLKAAPDNIAMGEAALGADFFRGRGGPGKLRAKVQDSLRSHRGIPRLRAVAAASTRAGARAPRSGESALRPAVDGGEALRTAPGQVTFQAHIELLQFFLAHRDDIVERLQGLLNAQRKPIEYLQDGPLLSRHVEDCFFTVRGITHSQSRLRGQLEEAHWASGFRPREIPGVHNGLADPAEMMMRGFHLWRQTRWPGRNGRVRYAHTLFNLYVIRCLELLSMRLWDAGSSSAPAIGSRKFKACSTSSGQSHRPISPCWCEMRDG